ncbi:MAG: hypothetical protein CM1200mP2_53250 [Planctomycetaceae bacterium]|nr:MAG: hypothetical protein CM1200mP2_53250 [Planctomycetaceae bacterium]
MTVALTEAADGRRHGSIELPRASYGNSRRLPTGRPGATRASRSPEQFPLQPVGRVSIRCHKQAAGNFLPRRKRTSPRIVETRGKRHDCCWKHNDLTTQLNLPIAGCDPSVVVARGIPHIVYVDQTCQAHEVWLNEKWRHHPLPAAPRPATDAVITYTSSALQVTYQTMFGACVNRISC